MSSTIKDTTQLDAIVCQIYQYEDNPKELETIKGELRLPDGTFRPVGLQLKALNPELFTKLFGTDTSHVDTGSCVEPPAKRRKIAEDLSPRANLETWLVNWKKSLCLAIGDCSQLPQDAKERRISRFQQSSKELEAFFADFPQKSDDEAFKKSIFRLEDSISPLRIDLDQKGQEAAKEAMAKCDEYLAALQKRLEAEATESPELVNPAKEKAFTLVCDFEKVYDPSPRFYLAWTGAKKESFTTEAKKMIGNIREKIGKARNRKEVQAALNTFKETLEAQKFFVTDETINQFSPFITKIQDLIETL